MIGAVEQRIIRKICEQPHSERSQTTIAELCRCPVSSVNKVVSCLCRKNLLHKPMKNAFSILDYSGLLLYWAFTRDIQDEETRRVGIKSIDSFERSAELRYKASELAPALFWAAKKNSGTHYTTYDTTYFYATKKVADGLKDEAGSKASAAAIIVDNPKEFIDSNQTFVDLISLNTWDSKLTAFKLAGKDKPIFGTRQALGEFL